jgi:uncharacterized protein
MRFNVAQLLKEQSGHTRQFNLHEDISQLDPDIVALATSDGTLQLIRTGEGIFVIGDLHTSVELTCSRCLDKFSKAIWFKLEEEFRPTIDIQTGASLPLPEDDEPATRIDAHHEIDLTEVIRQNLLLAIPQNPLCRSNCRGLCPTCGKNWNDGPCDCKHDDIDPRWDALKKLLKEDKE